MKRRKTLGTVLLAVGLGIVIASATPREACAQFFDGYGFFDGYLELAAGDFNGDGSDDLAVGAPGEDLGKNLDAGDFNGEGADDLAIGIPGEDLEILYFLSEGAVTLYNTYPFRGTGGDTSPDDVHRRVMD